MELEIPEVKAGTVVIKGVAREPGVRCKVAVMSTDEQVDPIGACVGQNGVRVQSVTQELSGERIDIIPWSENSAEFIKESLKPAKITHVEVDETTKVAKVYVAQDQRALAIGRSGQNVRLASNLTKWEIDILDADEGTPLASSDSGKGAVSGGAKAAAPLVKEAVMMISDLGIDDTIKAKLEAVSLEQVEQLKGLSVKDFTQVDGITEEEAEQIVKAVKKVK